MNIDSGVVYKAVGSKDYQIVVDNPLAVSVVLQIQGVDSEWFTLHEEFSTSLIRAPMYSTFYRLIFPVSVSVSVTPYIRGIDTHSVLSGSSTETFYLSQEDGDQLLQEDGSSIILDLQEGL